ncbi:MAG: SRPBCC family protein [Streptosporangiaceae bacterium]
MALSDTYIDLPRETVWQALADGRRYAEWVVGTREICSVDAGWPRVGSRLHFIVGYGPLKLSDRTVVRVSEAPERLELEVKAGPFGTVRVAIRLIEWGEGTVVILDEHPLRGVGAGLHGPPSEIFLQLRNRLMLRNLTTVSHEVARQAPRPTPELSA